MDFDNEIIKLNCFIDNKQCIDVIVTANPSPDNLWVRVEHNSNFPECPYCDVFDENGAIIYMAGESCIIKSYDESKRTVTLCNEESEHNPVFTIPYSQYVADFGLQWHPDGV